MTLQEPGETTIQRRTVLKHVGAVGISVAGVAGASGATSGSCEFEWDVGTCVTTSGVEVPVFGEHCVDDPADYVSSGLKGRIRELACCEGDGYTEMYYVQWCDDRAPSWVRQDDLKRTPGCCDECVFRWDVGTCIRAEYDDVAIYNRECPSDEPVDRAPRSAEGTILEYACCEGPQAIEMYYVEWCDDRLEDGWVKQADLERSSDCCDGGGPGCEFEFDVEDCVETTGYDIPVFPDECGDDTGDRVPGGSKGYVVDRTCCGDDDPTEMYLIEWCSDEHPHGWVRQEDLTESPGCCECVFDLEGCVATAPEETPIFEEPCMDEPFELVPEGTEGFVHEWICCEDGGPTEMYYVEWCDPDLPPSWVRQADLKPSSYCCEDEPEPDSTVLGSLRSAFS